MEKTKHNPSSKNKNNFFFYTEDNKLFVNSGAHITIMFENGIIKGNVTQIHINKMEICIENTK
jgi:hypothetical protein